MPDRTQTRSVNLEVAEILALLESDTKPETPAFVSGHDKLRTALSQSEHQGDEKHPMQWGCTCHGVNDYPVTVVPISSLPVQEPPMPASPPRFPRQFQRLVKAAGIKRFYWYAGPLRRRRRGGGSDAR